MADTDIKAQTETSKSHQAKTIPEREREILAYWKEHFIFQKTTGEMPLNDGSTKPFSGDFVFYDGPPFATGLPHYGHLLAGTIKDVIPRYKAMQGKRVIRRWGWDCHGLPIENLIQKELNLPTKKDIEDFGIEKFSQAAAASVLRYFKDWKEIVPRTGRFVDMEHYYKTMDPSFMESVWWSWKTLYENGLAKEHFKAMLICPHCETALSNFEVSQGGYKDITDISVTVQFELVDEPNTFVLAWTTTPWTLPGNTALALNKDVDYVKVRSLSNLFIVAAALAEKVFANKPHEIVSTHKGSEFVGKQYKPVFDYYAGARTGQGVGIDIVNKENIWKIWHADFITTDTGTGIAHQAPAFGADDLELAQKNNIPVIVHVGMDGRFKPEVTHVAGLKVKTKEDSQSADIEIIKLLAYAGFGRDIALFAKEKIIHPYPVCWRCETPLLNYAMSSWFVLVTQLKDRLVALNKNVKWVPHEIGEGRFGKWLEDSRDWSVSRSRFWGTPIPIWKSDRGDIEVLGSIDDIRAKTRRNKYIVMRHGEAEHNVASVLSSKKENPHHLTETGRAVVEASAELLDKENIDVIFVSPFVRTRETADIVIERRAFKGEVHIDDRIGEFNFGDYDGKTVEEYHRYFDSVHEKLTKRMPNGENLHDVRQRIGDFLYDIDARYEGKTILIVTHDGPATMCSAIAKGADDAGLIDLWTYDSDFINPGETKPLDFAVIPHNAHYELDMHRPYIDAVTWQHNGATMRRIPDVFDTWYDSGSMPFAQHHYPFEHKEEFETSLFPADFIAEGQDQTRGWFYSLLVLSTALFDKTPYQQVIVNGLILAEDGRKMSKSLKNYPELIPTIEKYGADALRYFLVSSPAVRAEDVAFSEKGLDEVVKKHFNRLLNVAHFYYMYGGDELVQNETKLPVASVETHVSLNVLDQWILARLDQTCEAITNGLDTYQLDKASRPIADFIDDLSTWYIRRSRDRFKSEDAVDRQAALSTTRTVLLRLSVVMAPFIPFLAEDLYSKMGGALESVHLETWPEKVNVNSGIVMVMAEARRVVSVALELRAKAGIKVRQPLAVLTLPATLSLSPELLSIIGDEVNVKEVRSDAFVQDITLDTVITETLQQEGWVRELIRVIQDTRKTLNFNVGDRPALHIALDSNGRTIVDMYKKEILTGASLADIVYLDSPKAEVITIEGVNVSFDLV